jgi:hypothetical protein
MHPARRLASYVLLAVTLVAAVNAAYFLGQVLALELRGAIDSAGFLYLMVGRGILNGLHPYVDLFESKPPGMFLLAALSLVITGDERAAMLMQVGIFVALPILLGAFAWREVRHHPDGLHRGSITGIAGLVGILLALYLEERSGGFQTESFGAFFASLYFLHNGYRRDA